MQFSRSIVLISYCICNLAFAAEQSTTQPFQNECVVFPPSPIIMDLDEKLNQKNIIVQSKKALIEKNNIARFFGGVKVASEDKKIESEEVAIDRDIGELETIGSTRYQDSRMSIDSEKLFANIESQQIIMADTNYRMNTTPGRGTAEKLEVNDKGIVLTESTFTTCLDEVPDWEISASEINLSSKDNTGETWNTVFRVKGVPVFYLPYFNFPLTKERKTGFLYPQISTSNSSGFEYGQPFYWNISENLDATITPYHMSERGTQLKTEFRYLASEQFGVINMEYLEEDDKLVNNQDSRHLFRYQHMGTFSENYRAYVDFSDISDDNYLVDIGSEQFSDSDAYLWRIGKLSYFSDNWHSTIIIQDFNVLGDNQKSYKTLPQIEFDLSQPLGYFNSAFNFYGEYSHFDISDDLLPTADRFHIETGINLPYSTPGWFVNSDFNLLHTIYQQDNIENINNNSSFELEESVTRTMPKVRIHTGLNFDRDTTMFFEDMVQTFEPQIQYLYISNKNQNDIYVYDSAALQDDFDGLFRDRRFSSVDRIAEANQVSLGASTRLLNDDNNELFHLSVGRIYYLNNSNISLDNDKTQKDSSSLAADLFIKFANRWQLKGDIQYDTGLQQTDKSQLSLDYRADGRNLFQLSHRYINDISGSAIEQISALSSFPINKNWQFVGFATQDLVEKRSLEAYAGLQYESCCWAIRVAYHRSINTNLNEQEFMNENRDAFDNAVMIQFILKGLGENQKPLGINDMLESGIFGDKRPYFLNN